MKRAVIGARKRLTCGLLQFGGCGVWELGFRAENLSAAKVFAPNFGGTVLATLDMAGSPMYLPRDSQGARCDLTSLLVSG